jgi:hypothetical protein
MKKLIYTVFLIFSGLAYSAPQEATLIIQYPHSIIGSEAGKVSVNGEESILLDPVFGAKKIVQIIKQVKAGTVTIESSHWKREDTSYINKFDVVSGKTYLIVLYEMDVQIYDVIFSTLQNQLINNAIPEKDEYKFLTIKNQVISIK